MTCTGYTKVLDLAAGDLLRLPDAKGTTLRVTRGTLWVTQDRDVNDVVLTTGDTWTVERDGLTLAEAQAGALVCLVGPGAEPAHLRRRAVPARVPVARWLRRLVALRQPRRFVPHF